MDERYNFRIWLREQIGKDYEELLAAGESACAEAERGTTAVKGAVAKRAAGALRFATRVKQFLFFLRSGAKPGGISDEDWEAYHEVAESLVEQGCFKPEVLRLWS